MDTTTAHPLLGGLSAAQFMRRHWHKKPLLVRQALADAPRLMSPQTLLALAGGQDAQSRLIVRQGGDAPGHGASAFSLRHGPLPRRSLPPLRRSGWTVLVQGVDLLHEPMHQLMQQFRFVPDARLDDIMVSFATDQGGVGPHVDSYDVFLLQLHGCRRWRIGRQKNLELVPDSPLKILAHFAPEHDWLLEPGDMLYLPPQWAHDGVAQGQCMTCSVGFRAPARDALARELLLRLSEDDGAGDSASPVLYRDRGQSAVQHPGEIPPALHDFARAAVQRALADTPALQRALGEMLSEPKPHVWFTPQPGTGSAICAGVTLDRRTRMLYDAQHIFVNGESWRASGRDMRLMRRLADRRALPARDLAAASAAARDLLAQWRDAGWLHAGTMEATGGRANEHP